MNNRGCAKGAMRLRGAQRWLIGNERYDDELQSYQRARRPADKDVEAFPFVEFGHDGLSFSKLLASVRRIAIAHWESERRTLLIVIGRIRWSHANTAKLHNRRTTCKRSIPSYGSTIRPKKLRSFMSRFSRIPRFE